MLWPLTALSPFPEFFVKHGVAVMTVRELFDFITDPSITSQNIDQYLDKVLKAAWVMFLEERAELVLLTLIALLSDCSGDGDCS